MDARRSVMGGTMDEHEYLENVDPELAGRLFRATAEGRISRRQLFRYMGVGAGSISLASILAACTSGSSDVSPSPSGSGGTTGGGTLTVAARQTPNGLDHDLFFGEEDQEIRAAIYENLMAFATTQQSDGLIVPDYDVAKMEGRLAESWDVSSDQRTLTLHLRQGVVSHAGNEFTADDVQYTWDRGWAVNGSSAFYAQVIFGFKEPNWHVVDKYTWELTTPNPNALLVMMMMNNDLNIVDGKETAAHAASGDKWATKWLASGDAGHGAFSLKEWSPGNQVSLQAFPDYYRGPSFFDEVVYKQVPEGSNRAALVEAGEVDIAENLPFVNLDQLKSSSAVKLWQTVGNRLFRFEVNNEHPPLNDARVRQALLYATPQDDILNSVFFGFASAEKSPVPSAYPDYDGSFWNYPHDPAKAQQQLSDAGVGQGFDMTITFDSSFELMRTTASILQSSFTDVGIRVKLDEVSSATYTTEVYQRKYQAFFLLEFPILPDAGYALALNYPSDSFLNSTGYSNKQVDGLIAQGFATLDAPGRAQIYTQIQQIMVAEDPPEVWVAEPGWQLVTNPSLKGVNWTTWEGVDFHDLSL
jgi:peptide/nickel transport system substrate-binding protein